MILFDQFCRERDMAVDFSVISRIPSETRDALALATVGDADPLAAIIAEGRQSQIRRLHPVIGLMTSEAAEVMKLMEWPKITPSEAGDTFRGQVLTTSYQTVLVQSAAGIRSVPLDVFIEPPKTNGRISITIPEHQQVKEPTSIDDTSRQGITLSHEAPIIPLIEGVTDWPVSVEAAAHERLFKSKDVVNMRQSAKRQMAKAWRDPEALLQKLEQAGGRPSKEVNALLKTMRNEPEKAGDLLGSTSFLGFKDEARRDALKAVLPGESMASYYVDRLETGLEQQIKGEKKWRQIMAEPLNDLSPAGREFVEKMNKAKDLPKGSAERLQIEQEAISDKFAVDEVGELAKNIHQRFGKGQEGFDRERVARTLNHLPKDANMRIRETMDTILSAEAQGRAVKNEIHIARLKERSYGHDQSFGLG